MSDADPSTESNESVERTLASPVERNIRALMERRRREIANAHPSEKIAAAIADFTGSMWSVLLHAAVFGLWIVINAGWLPVVSPWDPSLVVLAMLASVEAIFLSTFVLMNQNRLARVDDRRADLTLQIGLLAEHEMTKLVELVSAVASQLNVESQVLSEVDELTEEVAPEAVMDELDRKRPTRPG